MFEEENSLSCMRRLRAYTKECKGHPALNGREGRENTDGATVGITLNYAL